MIDVGGIDVERTRQRFLRQDWEYNRAPGIEWGRKVNVPIAAFVGMGCFFWWSDERGWLSI